MSSTADEETIVTVQDWIRGITFSVVASLIGAASKLSIRKSWLIDAERRHQQRQQQQNDVDFSTSRDEYEEVISPMNMHHRKEDDHFSPMKVGTLSPLPNHNEQLTAIATQQQFFNTSDPLLACDATHKEKDCSTLTSAKQLSWLLYLLGMIGMSFLNPLFCVLAMKYANPSILAPFSGLTIVWIILFSGMVLDEFPEERQKVACALIVAGEVLVALFGDHVNGVEGGIEGVILSYQDPAFHIFILLMTLYLIQLGIFIWHCPEHSMLRKMAWGSVGGSITGFQNFLKDALTIFDAWTKHGNDTFLPPEFFLFMLLAMSTSFAGLLCLSSCMKRYDATYSSAMFVVSFVISASLMSAVHYHTFAHLDGITNYIMYPLGLATLLLGAFALVNPKSNDGCHIVDCNPVHPSLKESLSESECKKASCRV